MNVGKKLRIAELEASVFELRGRVESLSREVRGLHEDRIRAQAVREAMRRERGPQFKSDAADPPRPLETAIQYQDQGMAEMPTPRQTVDHEDFHSQPLSPAHEALQRSAVNADGIRKDSPMAKQVGGWNEWRGAPWFPDNMQADTKVQVRYRNGQEDIVSVGQRDWTTPARPSTAQSSTSLRGANDPQ